MKEGLAFVFPGVETALCWPDQRIGCLLLLWMVWSESCFLISRFFPKELCFTVSSIVLCLCPSGVSSRCAGLTCVAHVGETFPLGAWGGIAEVGSFFPGFPSPKGACYFWCFVCPRQNKRYLFQVIAVLFRGSRSWFNVGT